MGRQIWVCLALIVSIAGLTGCTTDKTPPSGVLSADLVSATARVESLDVPTRRIVLKTEDGSYLRFRVGDEVRNLPQVKVGDQVKVTYAESLAWEVKKAGTATAGAALTQGVDRAAPGAKPAAAIERSLTVTSTIASISKRNGTVTLKSASGEMNTIKAKDPKNLDRVAVGDLVEITYTEGVAVTVETPVAK